MTPTSQGHRRGFAISIMHSRFVGRALWGACSINITQSPVVGAYRVGAKGTRTKGTRTKGTRTKGTRTSHTREGHKALTAPLGDVTITLNL